MECVVLTQGRWPAAGFFSARQDIRNGVEWGIHRDTDTVVVHLEGPISRLETELQGCGAALGQPMPGELWIIPAGTRYSARARGGHIRYLELYMDRAGLPAIAARAGHYDAFFHQAALRLESLCTQPTDLARMAAESLAHTMRLDFYQRFGGAPAGPPHPPGFLSTEQKRIESYISDNLAGPIRLTSLATLAGMTAHTFLLAFRANFGTTPAQYIIEQRLRLARRLLSQTSKDITTIALESGFASHAHFTSTFRSRTGITPSEFRRGSSVHNRVW